jgi:Mrp family chromosome partitioning ATPase
VRRFLLAHLSSIVLITLAVIAGAAALAWSQTPEYVSNASVLVYTVGSSASSTAQAPDISTEQGIAQSGAVVAMASRVLGVRPLTLQQGLSVSSPANTYILTISFRDANPHVARQYAQALAQAYVRYRTPQRHRGPAGRTVITRPAGGVRAVIVTPATTPASPVSPKKALDLAVALILGVVLGIGFALLRDKADDRLRGPADLEVQAGAPVLALIPAFRRDRRNRASALAVANSPDSRAADAYRDLQLRVLLAAAHAQAKTLLVVSAAQEDTGTVVANLAAALALSGRRVLVLCADLRDGRAHEVLAVSGRTGLTDVLAGRAHLSATVRSTRIPGLEVLPPGQASAGTALVAGSPGLAGLLRSAARGADFVIIEGPPVLSGAAASALADSAQMSLLVADRRTSTRVQVHGAGHEMMQAHALLIGCVLDNVGRRRRLPRVRPGSAGPDGAAGSPAPDVWPLPGDVAKTGPGEDQIRTDS